MGQGRQCLPFLFQGSDMDYQMIIGGLQVGMVVLAVLGGCAVIAQLKFGLWAGPKVARLFLMRGVK